MSTNLAVEELFRLLRTKDVEGFLSTPGIDLSAVGEFGRTLLHEAIAFGRLETADALIERGVGLEAQDAKGQTALHYAMLFQADGIARKILKRGGDPNALDNSGNNPLWTAALAPKKNYPMIKFLLEHGANPSHKNNVGRSVLDFSKQSKNKELWMLCGGGDDF